jgi:hypothetical protein
MFISIRIKGLNNNSIRAIIFIAFLTTIAPSDYLTKTGLLPIHYELVLLGTATGTRTLVQSRSQSQSIIKNRNQNQAKTVAHSRRPFEPDSCNTRDTSCIDNHTTGKHLLQSANKVIVVKNTTNFGWGEHFSCSR